MPSRAVLSSSVSFCRRQPPPKPSGGGGGLQVAPHRRSLETITLQAPPMPVPEPAATFPNRRPTDLDRPASLAMTRRSSLEAASVGCRASSPTVMQSRRSMEGLRTPPAMPTGNGGAAARTDLSVILDVGGVAKQPPSAGKACSLPPIALGQRSPSEKKDGLFSRFF